MIHYSQLHHSDFNTVNCIDRRDYSDTWCVVKNGAIVSEHREFKHPGFTVAHWNHMMSRFADNVQNGVIILFGAFDAGTLIGLSGLELKKQYGPENNLFNIGPMWISEGYRRQGIGKQLFAMMKQEARNRNIKYLYVSATPVPATVKFYINEGCVLLNKPDPELFALELEDIHLVLTL